MEERLGDRDHILLALDGPLAELPPVGQAAERLRVMVADGKLPRKVARTDDPFVVLAHAATIGPGTERAVHAQLSRFEHERLVGALVTDGAVEALAAMAAAGTQVTVFSSFAVEPVRSFLLLHGLDEHVRHLVARTGPDRSVLPPAPDLVTAAIHAPCGSGRVVPVHRQHGQRPGSGRRGGRRRRAVPPPCDGDTGTLVRVVVPLEETDETPLGVRAVEAFGCLCQ